MTARNKYLLIGAVAFLLATSWAGGVLAQSIYTSYYTPQFYGDRLVFYDEAGAPIYYEDNNAYAVPEDYPGYNELANNFLDNEDAYFQWFEDVGYANLHFRSSPVVDYYKPRYYNGYIVFYEGGQPVYYLDGVRHVIPRADRRYARLMRHYHQYRGDYDRWYRATGRNYRWYFRPVYTEYYRPMYYNGYLIFFDASGVPFYYRGGQVVYVPRTHARYRDYVTHYRSHRSNYDRWYRDRGRRYHAYRQPKSYRKRVVAPKAPRATQGRAEHRRYRPTIRPQRRPTITPKPHHPAPPPPRTEPRREGHRDQPRVAPPPRPSPPPRVAPPPPKRPGPPPRADRPKPPPPGLRGRPEKAKEAKPPKPPKSPKPVKPEKKKKKHGR